MKRLLLVFALLLFANANATDMQYAFITDTNAEVRQNQPQTVTLNVDFPEDKEVVDAMLLLTVYDAEFPDEGELALNGQLVTELFADQASSVNDNTTQVLEYPLPLDLLVDGENTFTFSHSHWSLGYTITKVTVQVLALDPDGGGDPDPPTGDYVTVAEFNAAVDALRAERTAALASQEQNIIEQVKQLIRDMVYLSLSVID